MTLLSAPTYFNLKKTKLGTVLVERGTLVKEDMSTKYQNVRQFYFQDDADNKLKCLTGGSLAYIVDLHNIDSSKVVKISYNGTEVVQNGIFEGKEAHQFIVELLEDNSKPAPKVDTSNADALE